MKKIGKVLKKNVKLVIGIIIGVLVSGGVVYAANLAATSIDYDDSNTSLGATTVQGAVEKLNEKAENAGPTCAVKLGDYISLTPTQTSYKIKSSLTGYTVDQTINPSELNLWRVIDINSDGSFDVVSEYVSSTNVYFNGTPGYANFVGALNTIAAQYQKSGYTIGSRHMGYGGQTSIIGDTSAFDGTTNTAPSTTSTSSPTSGTGQEYSGGVLGDTLYLKDYLLVKNVYGDVKANKVGTTTATSYWLASRRFGYSSSVFYFRGRIVYASGSLGNYSLRRFNSSWRGSSYSYAVRPILTLKSGITTSGGSGTKDSPYTLS